MSVAYPRWPPSWADAMVHMLPALAQCPLRGLGDEVLS
jgi:hypothetical protein